MRIALGSAMAATAKGQAFADSGAGTASFDDLMAAGVIIAGSPEEVTEWLIENCTTFQVGNIVANLAIGNMTEEVIKYNFKMYAERVLPNVRPLFEAQWDHEWWPKPRADRVPLSALAAEGEPQPGALAA